MNSTKRILLLRSLLFSLLLLFQVSCFANANTSAKESASPTSQHEEYVIITTYSPYYRWSSRLIQHIQSYVSGHCEKVTTTINLPVVGISTMHEMDSVTNELHQTLNKIRPKGIVLVGSSSFSLCQDIDTWFHNIPMLLIGGEKFTGTKQQIISHETVTPQNSITTKKLRKKYNITSFCAPVFIKEELELIAQIMPSLKTIYFIGSEDMFSRSKQNEMKNIISSQHKGIKFHPLTSDKLTTDSLLDVLNHLNPKTDAVIFSSWLSNNLYKESPMIMGRSIFMTIVSKAPIFSLRDNGWMKDSKDILGGYFLNEEACNNSLNQMLDKFTSGVEARKIPCYTADKSIIKLNYERLKDFDIDPELCPKESSFTNQAPSFAHQYFTEILIIATLLILLISILLIKVYRESANAKKANIEMKRSNAELVAVMEKANKAEQMKDEFIKNMTHEVRTPLNTICGFSELLSNEELLTVFTLEEKKAMQRGIANGATLLTTLMDNLLALSDIFNGTLNMQIGTCRINEIARNAIKEMKPLVNENVQISYETTVENDYTIICCRERIYQVLTNLISNAAKFTGEGSITLKFFGKTSKGYYRFTCTDTGCGIPAEKSEYIFERFTKIDPYIPGTGLGLAICRLIAEQLHGHLFLDASYTEGARLVFEIGEFGEK